MFHFLDEYYTFKEKVNKCWATHVEARRSDITETSLLYQARFSFTEFGYLNLLTS